MKQKILQWLEDHKQEIEDTYWHLHSIAEISLEEKETTAYLAKRIEELGLEQRSMNIPTGVVAEWQGEQPGKVAALRGDIDALWQNVDGEWKANHSCGHDAHSTMVLYALTCLMEVGFVPKGKLLAVFQPAEEVGQGAKQVIQSGVLADAQYMVGIHLRPEIEMPFGKASCAIYHGASAGITGKIIGRQAHAARPNEGINVIDSLAAIVNAVNAVKHDPTVPSSAKVTKAIVENKSKNIIPDLAEFAIDIRAQNNETAQVIKERVVQAVIAAGKANGAEIEVDTGGGMPAAKPNPYMEQIVAKSIVEALGEDHLHKPPVTPGGEDFHFYPLMMHSLQATMVGLGTGLTPGLHHPQMKFNLDALRNGIAILAFSMINLFEGDETDDH